MQCSESEFGAVGNLDGIFDSLVNANLDTTIIDEFVDESCEDNEKDTGDTDQDTILSCSTTVQNAANEVENNDSAEAICNLLADTDVSEPMTESTNCVKKIS